MTKRRVVIVLVTMTLGAGAVGSVGSGGRFQRETKAELWVSNGVTIIDPSTWVGKANPLAEYIDVGPTVNRDRWVVVLYRWDCDHCRRALPRYEALAARREGRPELPSVALVEVPPYGPSRVSAGRDLVRGRLSADREWFATTPVMIELVDGKVVSTAEGENAEFPPR
jgi:hypothetical protein